MAFNEEPVAVFPFGPTALSIKVANDGADGHNDDGSCRVTYRATFVDDMGMGFGVSPYASVVGLASGLEKLARELRTLAAQKHKEGRLPKTARKQDRGRR